jgi:hypothetical protein
MLVIGETFAELVHNHIEKIIINFVSHHWIESDNDSRLGFRNLLWLFVIERGEDELNKIDAILDDVKALKKRRRGVK